MALPPPAQLTSIPWGVGCTPSPSSDGGKRLPSREGQGLSSAPLSPPAALPPPTPSPAPGLVPRLQLRQSGLGQSLHPCPLTGRFSEEGPIVRVLGRIFLWSGWELALGNRILHSRADQTEAPGWGCPRPWEGSCWCPSQGDIGAPGPCQVIFPVSPISSPPGRLLPLQSLLLLPWSKCQAHSVLFSRSQWHCPLPTCIHAVTRTWVSFGPSSVSSRRVWAVGRLPWRPRCETVGKSLLSGPPPPHLGGGDNEACPQG